MDQNDKKILKKLLDRQKSGEDITITKNQFVNTITLPRQLEFLAKTHESTDKNYFSYRGNIKIPKFRNDELPENYLNNNFVNWRTQRKLTSHCSICGSTQQIEMHHIRHIKKGKVIGFAQVLKQLNRRQIPVCKCCHQKIHRGEYDGINLSEFYDPNLIIL